MKTFKISAAILFGIIVILVVIMTVLLGAKNPDNPITKEVAVVSGMSRAAVAQKLSEESLIKSQFAFFLYLKMIQANILPGTYVISSADSASIIADNLARAKFKTTSITIIEGWRAKDIENYLVNDKKLAQLKGFAKTADQYEGYLFPDTYEVKYEITINELIQLMRDNFATRTIELNVTAETVILASIVEREAKSDSERSAIAGVYVNRLKIGMNLEADATVQYAKGDWKILVSGDPQSVVSPYNTYLNGGLPPGPIANPGLASIKAAVNPESHDYFFYFHAQGQTYFSKTFAEHKAK
ncbi:MAG: endolytic transglycosylase MltG, partial [Patescibacteria group bacterium]